MNLIVIQAQNNIDKAIKDEILFEQFNNATVIESTINNLLRLNDYKIVVMYSEGNKEICDLELIKNNNIELYLHTEEGFAEALKNICVKYNADYILRVNACNPVINIQVLQETIKTVVSDRVDYCYFKGFPKGIAPNEIISKKVLLMDETLTKEDLRVRNVLSYIKNFNNINAKLIKASREWFENTPLDLSVNCINISDIEKIYNEKDILAYIKENYKPVPSVRNIEVTNLCNLKCIMCPRCGKFEMLEKQEYRNKLGTMSFEVFKKILDQFRYMPILTINGGEPLLNKDVKLMMKYCKDRNTKLQVTTNGLLMDDDMNDCIINNVHSLQISIDGATKETYEKIRVNGDFEKLIDNIENLMRKLKSTKEPSLQNIEISFTCTEENYFEMPLMIDLAEKLGIKQVNILNYMENVYLEDATVAKNLIIQDQEKYQNKVNETKIRAKEKNIYAFFNEETSFNYEDCEWIDGFWLTWQGEITPCCSIDRPAIINHGNLTERSIEELYEDKKWQDFRYNLFTNKPYHWCQEICGKGRL